MLWLFVIKTSVLSSFSLHFHIFFLQLESPTSCHLLVLEQIMWRRIDLFTGHNLYTIKSQGLINIFLSTN